MSDEHFTANIRLQAWNFLEGWTTSNPCETDELKKFEPWNFEKRLEMATKLADWALGATKQNAEETP